ncbi:glutathione S-transferase [Candidatus Woesearchaeota archaeon]|nr:glutathione S-transferase [Candidatus Woesearchaeota archaeon]
MITIYGIKGGHVARLRAALIMKGLEFEHVSVDMAKRSEEFLSKSVSETIPFMEDGNVTVCESIAATEYLDEKYPDTYKMLGINLNEKVTVLNVIWAIDRIGHYFVPLYVEKFGMAQGMKQQGKSHRAFIYDDQQKADFQKELTYRLGKLQALKTGKFFTSQFSSADASMLAMLGTVSWLGLEIGESWKSWMGELMQDEKIAQMNAPEDEMGVREI